MSDHYAMEAVQSKGLAANGSAGVTAVPIDRDTFALARSGKKQVLKRRFGLVSMVGLACSMMISWEGVVINLGIGLTNGGPAGLLYSIIITWAGMVSVFIAMGELSSMAPTAGGQYHWTSILASPSYRILLSYITGWVTVLTWVAAATAAAFLSATMTQQLISFADPSYDPQPYQGALIMWGVLLLSVIINTTLGPLLPVIELGFLFLHILGFFAILIPIVNLGPRGNAHELFTRFNNGGGWATTGLSFWVGIQGNTAAFLGTDCAIHMSEEVQKSERNVARSMVIAICINGALSFGIMLALLFSAGPIDDLLANSDEYPFIDIIFNATQSRAATIALVSYMIFMTFASTVSGISSGSRMVWSFSRDRGLPLWQYIRRVGKRSALPTTAIIVVVVCTALLGLIQIGSTVALNDILSLVVEGFCSSYLCVLLPLLYHRIKGNIAEPRDDNDVGSDSEAGSLFVWGPWRLKGWLGTLNNAVACGYLALVAFWSFWPPTAKVDATNMNFSSAVLGGVAIVSAIYYVAWARKTYHGPVTEVKAERL